MFDNLNPMEALLMLEQINSLELFRFIAIEIIFWTLFLSIVMLFLPKKYAHYKQEIFIFFLVLNVGLLFMGILLTLIMLLFGLSWATHREHKPTYESIDFDEYSSSFPMVYSKFQEGVLAIESHQNRSISSDEKIKSLKILYDSNAQGNIGEIKLFLSDGSDETRLYAFALISSFEKRLNDQLKEIHKKITQTIEENKLEEQYFNLAQIYWQFIFHGVANENLTLFYTEKIEKTLNNIKHKPYAYILLGKIHIFNKKYKEAEKAFHKAIELGAREESVSTFLAEIKYEQKEYNSVSKYMNQEQFAIDLRMKPIYEIWKRA